MGWWERPTVVAVVWVVTGGEPPRPLRPPPFDEARLNRPCWQRKAEEVAEPTTQRNARILAGRIAPTRRWQLSTSQETRCLTTGLTYREQRDLVLDETPAAKRGVTLLRAASIYNQPYREMYRAYVHGVGNRQAPIGRRDHWGCWSASRADLEATFGEAAARREAQAAEPEWMTRTAQRLARLQIRGFQGGAE